MLARRNRELPPQKRRRRRSPPRRPICRPCATPSSMRRASAPGLTARSHPFVRIPFRHRGGARCRTATCCSITRSSCRSSASDPPALKAFFGVGAARLLIVHAYVLLHFVLLAGKVGAFDAELRAQIAGDYARSRLRRQLPSNIFVKFIRGTARGAGRDRRLSTSAGGPRLAS